MGNGFSIWYATIMCGIIGYSLTGGAPPTRERFESARDLMTHRGPDGSGTWAEGAVGLGHRRLSIIDLEGGAQPMVLSGCRRPGALVLSYNGEIYNFQSLKQELESRGHRFRTRCDTEVILHLYEEMGPRCVDRLRGMFAFGLYDASSGELFLARDRLGVKPLVYAETGTGFYFASEIQSVLALGEIPPRANVDAIGLYLALQYIPSPQTGFVGVRKLPPAHTLLVKNGRAVSAPRRYWRPNPRTRWSGSYWEAQEDLRSKLAEATRLRMISDVPLGAFLSGGIDSSLTVVEMSRASRSVKTFSVGFENERFNELPDARRVAESCGTAHSERRLSPRASEILPDLIRSFGEPFADHSAVPTHAVSKAAREFVTVALTGDGGDESFGGYKRYAKLSFLAGLDRWGLIPLWSAVRRLSVAVERRVNPGRRHLRFPHGVGDEILGLKGLDRYMPLVRFFRRREVGQILSEDVRRRIDLEAPRAYLSGVWDAAACAADDADRAIQTDLATYLPEDILFKVDIASMRASLEVRSPFLDHELVEFAAGLPVGYKLAFPNRTKRILKDAYARDLPASILNKSKQGFTPPVGDWLRGGLKSAVAEALFHRPSVDAFSALIDPAAARQLFDEHMAGARDHANRLWSLYVLALWIGMFKVNA